MVSIINPDDNNTKKELYRRMGQKLKLMEDRSIKESRNILINGLEDLSKKPIHLPPDIVSILFSLKEKTGLPLTYYSKNEYKKPKFRKKDNFYNLLASELVSIGLAYQRTFLEPVTADKLFKLLLINQPWWQCSKKDVVTAIARLRQKNIAIENSSGFLFEPLTNSKRIVDFITLIYDHLDNYSGIEIQEIKKLFNGSNEELKNIMMLLQKNNLCKIDENLQILYLIGL